MYLVSACLCGVNCKYNGKNNTSEKVLELLQKGEAILVCPEQLGGLETPRPPAEISGDVEKVLSGTDKILTIDGLDVTDKFLKGALEVLNIAKETGIKQAILKDGSPSCGSVFIYDGSFSGRKIEGEGLTTYLLRKNGIEVFTENYY